MRTALIALGAALLMGSPAAAHVPHDTLTALAAPADLGDGPWVAAGEDVLLTSTDGGARFEVSGGMPCVDRILSGVIDADGRALLLGARRVWVDDGGWRAVELASTARAMAAYGDGVVIATAAGLLAGPVDALAPLTAAGARDVEATAFGVVATLDDGGVVVLDGESLPAPPLPAITAVPTDAGPVAADAEGGLWRWDGAAWAACGDPLLDGAPVVQLGATHGWLLASSGVHGPVASADGCASFEDRALSRDAVLAPEPGGAASAADAIAALLADGDRWFVAGWIGWWSSDDAGLSWREADLLPPDYTRGLATDGGRIWVGANSGGVAYTDDDGACFAGLGAGLSAPNVQRVSVDAETGEVWAVVGHVGWRSDDGGESWRAGPTGSTEVIAVEAAAGVGWGVVVIDGVSVLASAGPSAWEVDAGAMALLDGAVSDLAVVGDELCAWGASAARVVCLPVAGGAARLAVDLPDEAGPGFVGRSGEAWLVGAGTRLLRSTDGEAWELVHDLGLDRVVAGAVDADGAVVIGTRAGALLASTDGGVRFAPLDEPVPGEVQAAMAHPDGGALVGTYDGVFRVDPVGLTATRWGAWQRVDDASGHTHCDGCGGVTAYDLLGAPTGGAVLGTLTQLHPEVTLWWTVRGAHLRLLGEADRAASGALTVDGVVVGTLEATEAGVLLDVDVPPGWHRVELRGMSPLEDAAWVDAIEAWDEPPECAAPAAGCGCASGGGAGGVAVIALAALVGLRRRRLAVAAVLAAGCGGAERPVVVWWTVDTLGEAAAEEADFCGWVTARAAAHGLDARCLGGAVPPSTYTAESHARLLWPENLAGAGRSRLVPECGAPSALERIADHLGGSYSFASQNGIFDVLGRDACGGPSPWSVGAEVARIQAGWIGLEGQAEPLQGGVDALLAGVGAGEPAVAYLNAMGPGGHVPRCWFDPSAPACAALWQVAVDAGIVDTSEDPAVAWTSSNTWDATLDALLEADPEGDGGMGLAWESTLHSALDPAATGLAGPLDALLAGLADARRLDDLVLVLAGDHGESPCAEVAVRGGRNCQHGGVPDPWTARVPVVVIPASAGDALVDAGLAADGTTWALGNLAYGLAAAVALDVPDAWPAPEPVGAASTWTCLDGPTGARVDGEVGLVCDGADCVARSWALPDGVRVDGADLPVPAALEGWSGHAIEACAE